MYKKFFSIYDKSSIILRKYLTDSKKTSIIFKKYLRNSNSIKKVLNKEKLFSNLNIDKKKMEVFYNQNKKYSNIFIKNSLKKELLFLNYNQLLMLDIYKFSNVYLSKLSKFISKFYNKKVEFNIINLKYHYLDSNIFSSIIAKKLSNRKNRIHRIFTKALKFPKIFKLKYLKKRNFMNFRYNNLDINNFNIKSNKKDELNTVINKLYKTKLSNLRKEKSIFKSLRYRKLKGIRLQGKGRLTLRLTASRSIKSIKSIGNLQDLYVNNKLGSVTLRGCVKPNVDYININSKTRNGSFGLKG